LESTIKWFTTDEGAAVGGAFDGDTATGMAIAHRVAGVRLFRRS
jgi:hypothetical protein